jgi:hypothetical protein
MGDGRAFRREIEAVGHGQPLGDVQWQWPQRDPCVGVAPCRHRRVAHPNQHVAEPSWLLVNQR